MLRILLGLTSVRSLKDREAVALVHLKAEGRLSVIQAVTSFSLSSRYADLTVLLDQHVQ